MSYIKKNPPSPSYDKCPQWRADYLLVQRYLSGDITAWNVLYSRAYPVVLRFLRRQNMVRSFLDGDVADILSESFLRCQMYACRFQGRSSFSAYACGFARYVALEMVKKKMTMDCAVSDLLILYHMETFAMDPERILLRSERDRYLWAAYNALSIRHQILIGYLVLKQNTYHEARRATGLRVRAEMEAELSQALRLFKRIFLKFYYGNTHSTQRRKA